VLLFLGLLSAATGFGAEGTRIKVNKNRMFMFCVIFFCLSFDGVFFFFFLIVVLLLCLYNLALVLP
jgi:hypothetical protein